MENIIQSPVKQTKVGVDLLNRVEKPFSILDLFKKIVRSRAKRIMIYFFLSTLLLSSITYLAQLLGLLSIKLSPQEEEILVSSLGTIHFGFKLVKTFGLKALLGITTDDRWFLLVILNSLLSNIAISVFSSIFSLLWISLIVLGRLFGRENKYFKMLEKIIATIFSNFSLLPDFILLSVLFEFVNEKKGRISHSIKFVLVSLFISLTMINNVEAIHKKISNVLSARYVLDSKKLGANKYHLMKWHILPQIGDEIIMTFTNNLMISSIKEGAVVTMGIFKTDISSYYSISYWAWTTLRNSAPFHLILFSFLFQIFYFYSINILRLGFFSYFNSKENSRLEE